MKNFDLIVVQSERYKSSFILLLVDNQFSKHRLLNILSFNQWLFGPFVKHVMVDVFVAIALQ